MNQDADEGIVEGYRTSSANADGYEQTLVSLSIRASLKRTGKEMKFIVEGVTNSAPADTTLIRLLVRGRKIAKRMFELDCPPLEAIAHEERLTASYATRLVRLAFLAPDIVAAILAGKQPLGLTANKLMADTRLPLDWRDQRGALGFGNRKVHPFRFDPWLHRHPVICRLARRREDRDWPPGTEQSETPVPPKVDFET